jgi:hypothetical protein
MNMLKGTVVLFAVLAGMTSCRAGTQQTGEQQSVQGAAGAYSEADMSPQLLSFRDKWLAIETPQSLHALLNELEAALPAAPADLKYFGLQIVGLKDLRGFRWRLNTLADDDRTLNSLYLTAGLSAHTAIEVYAPYKNWKAMATYLSEPLDMPGEQKFSEMFPQFQTVDQLQTEIVTRILPKFVAHTEKIAEISIPANKALVWDNTAAAGKGTFADALDRYQVIGEAEKGAKLAGRHLAAHNALVFAARNLNDFAKVSKALGGLYGFDGCLIGEINGATSQERTRVIRGFSQYLTLRNPGFLVPAFDHLKRAVGYARKSWSVIKASPDNEYASLNPAQIKPFSRMTENELASAERMITGSTALRSRVTGEVVNVNLPAMYANPPADMKVFLPTSFEPTTPWITNASGYKVRNASSGAANGWNVGAFQPYFPSITSNAEVQKTARILAQSWGGGIFAMALGNAF